MRKLIWRSRRLRISVAVLLAWSQCVSLASAAEFSVFKKTYVRKTGPPETVKDTFSVLNPVTSWKLKAVNGSLEDQSVERVSSAVVTLNDKALLTPSNFNQNVSLLEVPAKVLSDNALKTELRSKPGGQLTLEVLGEDRTPPAVAWLSPRENQSFDTEKVSALLLLTDDIAGLKPASLKISLNGVSILENFLPKLTKPALNITLQAELSLPEGPHRLLAEAEDLAGQKTSQAVSFTVTAAPGETPDSGFIHGRVFHSVTKSPLFQAQVTVRGLRGRVSTDAEGKFVFPAPGSGTFIVTLEKQGFTRVQRRTQVESKRDIAVDPVFLTPLDSAVTQIGPGGGFHLSSDGEVQVEFPAGALNQTIPVRATRYRSGKHLPTPLPEQSHFTYAVNFQPDGISFSTPVTYRIKNDLGFPAGTPIPVGIYKEAEARWEALNMAQITADGRWVQGQISSFTSIDCNLPVILTLSAASPETPPEDLVPTKDKQASCKAKGCEIDLFDGALRTDITLPSIRDLGETKALTFRYDSNQAFPRVLVGSGSKMPRQILLPPTATTAVFEFQGERAEATFKGTSKEVLLRNVFPAKNGRGQFLKTGLYKFHYRPSNDFSLRYATADFFNGPPRQELTVVAPELVSFLSPVTRKAPVVNERESPFGSGWSLEGLERIYPPSDGSLLLTDGTGSALPFTPASRTAGLTHNFGKDPEAPFGVVLPTSFGAPGNIVTGRFDFDSRGNLYVADGLSNVYKITPAGVLSTFASELNFSTAVAVDQNDHVYVAELTAPSPATIWKYLPDGSSRTPFARISRGIIRDLAFDPQGNLYAAAGDALFRISPDGQKVEQLFQVLGAFGGVAVDAGGNIFATVFPFKVGSGGSAAVIGSPRLVLRLPDGFVSTYSVGVKSPRGMVIDPQGNLLVADQGLEFDPVFLFDDQGLSQILRVTPDRIAEPLVKGENQTDFRGASPVGGNPGVFDLLDLAYSPTGELFALHRFRGARGVTVATVSKVVSTAKYFPPPGEFSEISKNPDGSFVRKMKDGVIKNFNFQGFLTSVVDRNGNTTTYTYDPSGKLTQIKDPVGRNTVFSYTVDGKLASVQDAAGRTTFFTVDPARNLTQVTFPDLSKRRFAYDAEHRLIQETDPREKATDFVYDSLGHLKEEILPEREVLEGGRLVLKRSRRLFQAEEASGLVNNLPPGTGTPENPHPELLRKDVFASSQDALGRVSSFQRDRFGAPSLLQDALGQKTTIGRHFEGQRVDIDQPNGLSTTLQYDGRGNLRIVSHSEPSGATPGFAGGTTFFTHEPQFNQLEEIRNPVNRTSFFQYDPKGNLTKILDPFGISSPDITELSYTPQGLLSQVKDSVGNLTRFTYDAFGNLKTTTDPLLKTTTLEYDSRGNVVRSVDPLGRATQFQYDALNRLTQVTDPDLKVTRYTYDPAGNLTQVTDAKGNVTRFEYDALDRLTKTIDPPGAATRFFYDARGNLARTVTRKGERIDFTYDALDRLTQKSTPQGITTFQYDTVGNLTLARDPDSLLRFEYDPLSRLTKARTGEAGNPAVSEPEVALTYEYDPAGNRTKLTSPVGETRYDYLETILPFGIQKHRGNLVKLTNPFNEVFTFEYDPLSRRTRLTRPNNTGTALSYNPRSELLEIKHLISSTAVPFSTFTYTYDDAGNRKTKQDALGLHTFTYDSLNRLTQAQAPNPESYTYDGVGDRLTSHLSPTHLYDAGNRLLEDSLFTYTYDANGNLIQKQEKATAKITTYTYDPENQLIRIDFPDTTFARYSYDALGRRIQKRTPLGQISLFIYDAEDILLEFNQLHQLQRHFTHGPGIDEPLALRDLSQNQSFFYYPDGLGSITEIRNSSATLSGGYTYDSFGNILNQSGSLLQPYTFTSRELDPESGLYYFRARYYDPRMGRFIGEDVSSFSQFEPEALNKYVYVINNPINMIDPLGEFNIPGLNGSTENEIKKRLEEIAPGQFTEPEKELIAHTTRKELEFGEFTRITTTKDPKEQTEILRSVFMRVKKRIESHGSDKEKKVLKKAEGELRKVGIEICPLGG